ncbi:MAG: glycosyltransferase family 4 protein [Thermoplasmata archaeon]|nr:MAG: glycosyltransferase family 4 protein [Thermoplasmata archaeon]
MDLKVCIVSPFYPNPADVKGAHIGGVERVVQGLSHSLTKLGVKVTVVASFLENRKEYDKDVEIIRIKRRLTLFRTPIFPWPKVIDNGFDIVHTFATYPLLSDKVVTVCNQKKVPSVLTYQFDGVIPGIFGNFLAKVYYSTLAKKMIQYTIIIATTYSYAKHSVFLRKVPDHKLRIIPNGMDIDKFNPQVQYKSVLDKYSLDEGYALFVGRLVSYKGLHVLFEAMKNSSMKLVIAGEGPLEKKLKKYQVGKFLGHVPDKDLPALYRGAGVTLLPSINSNEAFGMCLLESMACGKPVVSSDLPGVREIAKFGGITVPIGDSEALYHGIENVLKQNYEPLELHNRIKNNFSWDIIAKKNIMIYEEAHDKMH